MGLTSDAARARACFEIGLFLLLSLVLVVLVVGVACGAFALFTVEHLKLAPCLLFLNYKVGL